MARTAEVHRLTDAHRLAQVQIRARVVAQLLAVYPLLDVTKLTDTTAGWLAAALPIVRNGHQQSTNLAAGYYEALRSSVTGATDPIVFPPVALDERAATTSLLVTGPIAVKAGTARGINLDRLTELTARGSAEAGARQSLSGGRDLITTAVQHDDRASGWVRVASDSACNFCLDLVDWSEGNAALRSDFQAHDHCGCSAEPTFN